MKGLFIPEITAEMFRNGCLESIEALMAEGEVYDIEYDPKSAQQWIPCSERLPEEKGYYLTTTMYQIVYCDYWNGEHFDRTETILAWMPLPEPYKEEE